MQVTAGRTPASGSRTPAQQQVAVAACCAGGAFRLRRADRGEERGAVCGGLRWSVGVGKGRASLEGCHLSEELTEGARVSQADGLAARALRRGVAGRGLRARGPQGHHSRGLAAQGSEHQSDQIRMHHDRLTWLPGPQVGSCSEYPGER